MHELYCKLIKGFYFLLTLTVTLIWTNNYSVSMDDIILTTPACLDSTSDVIFTDDPAALDPDFILNDDQKTRYYPPVILPIPSPPDSAPPSLASPYSRSPPTSAQPLNKDDKHSIICETFVPTTRYDQLSNTPQLLRNPFHDRDSSTDTHFVAGSLFHSFPRQPGVAEKPDSIAPYLTGFKVKELNNGCMIHNDAELERLSSHPTDTADEGPQTSNSPKGRNISLYFIDGTITLLVESRGCRGKLVCGQY